MNAETELKQKLEAIFPRDIGAVITKRDGRVNLCPINFQAISTTYEQPLSVCIGLDNHSYTLETILKTKEFVYAYPSREQLMPVLWCGTVSGRDQDKLTKVDLKFKPSEVVSPPQLAGAVLNCECRVVHSYNVGEFTIVVAEIKRLVGGDKLASDKIYSLGGQRYGVIKGLDVLQDGRPQLN